MPSRATACWRSRRGSAVDRARRDSHAAQVAMRAAALTMPTQPHAHNHNDCSCRHGPIVPASVAGRGVAAGAAGRCGGGGGRGASGPRRARRGTRLDALRRSAEIQMLGLRAATRPFRVPALCHRPAPGRAGRAGSRRATPPRATVPTASWKAWRVAPRLSALYVMDDARQARWRPATGPSLTSFVGHSYRDRPYFIEARNGRTGTFYGVGLTTGIPGYFIAAPVRQEGQGIVGVVAVKVSLDSIEAAWALLRDPILLRDARGIVFLGNAPDWQYHSTRPLTAMELEWLRYFKPYGERITSSRCRGRCSATTSASACRCTALVGPAAAQPAGHRRDAARIRLDADRHRRPPADRRRTPHRLGADSAAAAGAAAGGAVLAPARAPLRRAAPGPPRAGTARATSARAS